MRKTNKKKKKNTGMCKLQKLVVCFQQLQIHHFCTPASFLEVVKCITYRLPDGKPNFTWDQTSKSKRLQHSWRQNPHLSVDSHLGDHWCHMYQMEALLQTSEPAEMAP
jgi:hypothetical protein